MSYDLQIINGDLTLQNGDLARVVGQDKLIQDILKICLTTAGCNLYQPWYGSFISKTLIGAVFDTDITNTIAQNQLQNALENLKKLQQLQLTDSIQAVTLDEHIAGIQNISVSRNAIDPRLFEVAIKVLSRSFRSTNVNFKV